MDVDKLVVLRLLIFKAFFDSLVHDDRSCTGEEEEEEEGSSTPGEHQKSKRTIQFLLIPVVPGEEVKQRTWNKSTFLISLSLSRSILRGLRWAARPRSASSEPPGSRGCSFPSP